MKKENKREKKKKERTRERKLWVAVVVPLARVLYKAMRSDARKKKDVQGRKEGQGEKEGEKKVTRLMSDASDQ